MKIVDERLTRTTFKVALVVSRFNPEVTESLLTGALDRLKELDFPSEDITVVKVPGAIEIPIAAQRLSGLGTFSAIIALGAVIRGETDHYDYVCESVTSGCQTVALQNDTPVLFGVLTTPNEELALARATGPHNKGREAVDAAVEIVSVLKKI